ncbi:hypothetical protein MKK69_19445 [Methylobacterium sp. J-026]|uniref:hypothetical protein n=1 Tax=Methylobacterium sp. J-026 TaxID=2836624 RepID=UPI001FBA8C54|nr:hypothetical protein [Methylobacterium sp. J-026]MCJ2136199.1 hypothetical protein [Methylobacterium sp. J-026]
MVDMYEFIQVMRREAMNVVQQYQRPGTLVATSYNPDIHAVKGMIVPAMVESGWVPLTSMHAGDGYGIMVGPNVGTAEALDGDVFDIHFDGGDPSLPVAKSKHFSVSDSPPRVESGEILMKHQLGGSFFLAKDGAITVTHKDGGSIAFDANGNVTIKSNNQTVTVDAGSGGLTYKAKSHTFDGDMNVTGNVNSTGTINGQGGVQNNGMALT